MGFEVPKALAPEGLAQSCGFNENETLSRKRVRETKAIKEQRQDYKALKGRLPHRDVWRSLP